MAGPTIAIAPCHALSDYVEAVRRAGGEPRLLDPSVDAAETTLGSVDGLVLTGGADVDPSHYRESAHASLNLAEPGRDDYDLALCTAAVELNIPLLAICRGLQVLNVAHGGSLVQDIPSDLSSALEHEVSRPRSAVAHDVWVSKGSLLWSLLLDQLSEDGAIPVNSRHHQSAKRIAAGFEVSATAPDGVVEAIERRDRRFCVGVQWHPENFWRTGQFRGLFEGLVRASAERTRTQA